MTTISRCASITSAHRQQLPAPSVLTRWMMKGPYVVHVRSADAPADVPGFGGESLFDGDCLCKENKTLTAMPWSPQENWGSRIGTFFQWSYQQQSGPAFTNLNSHTEPPKLLSAIHSLPFACSGSEYYSIASFSYYIHHHWEFPFHRSNLVLHLSVQWSQKKNQTQLKKKK